MAFKSDKFTYQPLQEPMEFRLLELLPGEQHETLKCSLTHNSLTSHPYYHAVSYTWGAPGPVHEIELGGVAHSIQANLSDFLRQLRLAYAAVTLWVDALCINGNDIPEKNIQVPLMGLIYSYAKSVFVWLGPQGDGSEEYFDYCNKSVESRNLSAQSLQNAGPAASNPTSAAIASLQRRRYWTRTWIIQEIVLASDIHLFCGDRISHWPNFVLHMPDHDSENNRIGMRNPTHAFGRLTKLRIIATRLTLRQLLFQCHMSRCSEPRDLIYCLLNIATDTRTNADSIVVDYSCSLKTLFLQSMSCCPLPQKVYDGIPCLQFCDTLSTRLGVDLERALACAKEIVQSSPTSALAEKLASRSYFAKLTRFGRFITQPPNSDGNSIKDSALSQAESKTQHSLTQYTVREIPGTATLHHMWSFHIPEATETIFIFNFESPTKPSQYLACICRPIHDEADEYGVIPYNVVGLEVILQQSKDKEGRDCKRNMQATFAFLHGDLNSLRGRVVNDSIPGYGLDVGLLELTTLCMFARVAGSFVRLSIENTTAAEHWQ